MKIGDLQLLGGPGDAPEERSVEEDCAYFYGPDGVLYCASYGQKEEGKEMAPMATLLPTLTAARAASRVEEVLGGEEIGGMVTPPVFVARELC